MTQFKIKSKLKRLERKIERDIKRINNGKFRRYEGEKNEQLNYLIGEIKGEINLLKLELV